MTRQPIKLSSRHKRLALRAFTEGNSNRQICQITRTSQTVWERELRELMGDAPFEEQLEQNKLKNRRLGRPSRPGPARPRPRPRQGPGKKGRATPIVCIETGKAFDSISKAAAATGLGVNQIKRSLAEGIKVCGPGQARAMAFRPWREGDPPVKVVQGRGAIPIRFADGRCYPSVSALARAMNAQPRHVAAFCRRLKEINYSASSAPLPLAELRRIAELLPMLERHQLEQRILESELHG